MTSRKPAKTAADYLVIALSPALIMALVGSFCFFLLDVFYSGPMSGGVRWVMFWFVLAIVLVARIGIEQSPEHAAIYGILLALSVWLYLMRTHPGYLLGLVLMALVWFFAHKLVWDCTLVDDEDDSSGEGLLQHSPAGKRRGKPGVWVVWFSLAALPLFGLGETFLPPGSPARLRGFIFLVIYMTAALGLLVTTSFLGLRRYLRQRYLRMPPVIALAWLRWGAGVALIVLAVAMFLPRPGAHLVWNLARHQIDYRLQQASQYALSMNAPGTGAGRPASQPSPSGAGGRPLMPSPGPGRALSAAPVPLPNTAAFHFLRTGLYALAALLLGWWLVRCRHLLREMFRAAWTAFIEFFRRWLALAPYRTPVPTPATGPTPRRRGLADFRNPFFATGEHTWPPAEVILYTFDALQAWAGEQGMELHQEQTPREVCEEISSRRPDLAAALRQLAFLYGHAAYSDRLPAQCNLEPLKELWRNMTANLN